MWGILICRQTWMLCWFPRETGWIRRSAKSRRKLQVSKSFLNHWLSMQELLAFRESWLLPVRSTIHLLWWRWLREDWDRKTLGEVDAWPLMWLKNVTPLCHALFKIASFDQFHCYSYFWDYSLESLETKGTSIFKVAGIFSNSWVLQSYKGFQGLPLW